MATVPLVVIAMGCADMRPNELQRLERLVMLLTDWADWMKGYRMRIGWPARSVGMESGYVSKSFDDMADDADAEMYRLIDTAVEDLEAGPKAALYKRYGVAAVFRFPRGNYETLLIESHEQLLTTLPKKGVAI
jgi:hypothetical protein